MVADFKIFLLGATALADLIFSTLLLVKGKKRQESISFALFVIAIVAWAFGLMMFYLSSDPSPSLFWAQTLYFAGIAIAALFFRFSFVFPKRDKPLAPSLSILIFLPVVIIFYLFYFTDLVFTGTFVENGVKGFLYGPLRWVFDIPFSVYFLWAFTNLFIKYKKSSGQLRLQLRYTVFSFLAALIIASVTNVGLLWFGVFDYIWIGPLGTLIVVIATTYAIIRYRLMDIRLAFKRGVVFIGSIASATTIGIIISSLLGRFSELSIRLIEALGILTALIVFLPIRGALDRLANKYFFASVQSQHTALKRLNENLTTIIDLEKLSDTIVNTILDVLGLEQVALFVKEPDSTAYKLQNGIGFKEDNGFSLAKNSLLIQRLQNTRKPLLYDELSRGDLKQDLSRTRADLCLPLALKQDLIGYIVLGRKKSGDAYTKEDLELLESLATQASLAIENSRLYDQIKDFNENLKDKVKEQTKNITDLYKMKADFLDTASHQLLTPTSIFKGLLSLFKEEGGTLTPKQKEFLENSIKASTRLENTINGIMEANDLQGGIDQSHFHPIDVVKVVEEAINSQKELAQERKLSIDFQKPESRIPSIIGHERFIKSALKKIISNALWYTQEGKVTISVSYQEKDKTTAKDDTVSIIIKDTGIGLTEDDKKILFNQFSKGRGSKMLNVNSSGLGLYIVKKVAELHHGDLKAESEGEDEGSTFTLTLPVVQGI